MMLNLRNESCETFIRMKNPMNSLHTSYKILTSEFEEDEEGIKIVGMWKRIV